MPDLLVAALLGLVEGMTEFLPVSSTGHLIAVGHLLNFRGPTAATFDIFIQLGAILAVALHYRDKVLGLCTFTRSEGFTGLHAWSLLAITTLPALVIGAVLHGVIKEYLFNPTTVAIGLGLGGLAILLVERSRPDVEVFEMDALRWREALAIGVFQCFALWPGISRAAATILGAMLVGVGRKTAAEYSFLAAIPVIVAATAFDLYANRAVIGISDMPVFAIGFVVSFVSAWFAIRFFLRLLDRWTLRPFGWYRIIVAPALLILWL